MDFLPQKQFRKFIERYRGDYNMMLLGRAPNYPLRSNEEEFRKLHGL